MLTHKKVARLIICSVILFAALSCSESFAAYRFATTDMTWAEFYAGETGKTASALESEGLDAISSPTTHAISRFPLLLSASGDFGSIISGEKAVQVRMTDEVYNALADRSRYTFVNETFTEYKDVNADGTFGKMIEPSTTTASTARVVLNSGTSSTWGHYTFSISNVSIDIGLSNDKIARTYLGAYLETSDGNIYGLRHDCNLWSDAGSIAFCVNASYVEPHGNGVQRDYDYTASLEGKTVTRITYMLKDRPDIVIPCNVLVKRQTTARVTAQEPEGGFIAGENVKVALTFSNVPSGATYNITSLYTGSGRNRTFITDYTYQDGVLTINGTAAPASYTAVFASEGYVDISATFSLYTTDATSSIISQDNNLGGVSFLLTPKGAMSSVDAQLESGNFVNASEYTDPDNNFSVPLTGRWHEVEDSGFSFDITLSDVPSGKTAVVGWGKIFYLTPENCGEIYPSIYAAVSQLPTLESGYKHIEGDEFRSLGLKAMSIRNGEAVDMTQYVGAGAMISDDEHILIFYGVMLADANTGEVREGEVYTFSDDGETLLSDGSRDGHLRAAWYFEVLDSDPASVQDSNNAAGISFSYMPKGFFETADQSAENAKIAWLSQEYGNVHSGGSSAYISGYPNQIAGNSGFRFTIPADTSKIPSGYSAASGFERPFTFTESNIGASDYATLRSRVESLPTIEGTDWRMPGDSGGAILRAANIHVVALYPDNTSRDVTNEIQYGVMVSSSGITMNYGAIAVDRALTSNEGAKLDMVFEASPLMSDGSADGNVTAAWYLTHETSSGGGNAPVAVAGSPSGGCDSFSLASAVMLGVLLVSLRHRH